MQFSKKVSTLARLHNLEEKDVLFAMLTTAGASVAESFAVIFRPAISTNASLSTKASNHISQRPALRRLMDELEKELHPDTDTDNSDSDTQPTPPKRKGRPRKDTDTTSDDVPSIDYTDKDALLKELARIAERGEKESDRLAALREIGSLQRMKQEAAVEDEKRVIFYIPLTFDRCNELLAYLRRYYTDADHQNA